MQATKVKIDQEISLEFISEIKSRLSEEKIVRRILPAQGRLHIDRNLPFLCIYRRPSNTHDNSTGQLITGEASYLLSSGARRHRKGTALLVKAIVEALSQRAGAFLIMEIWASKDPISIIDSNNIRTAPSFRIYTPPGRLAVETIESIESTLKRIVVSKKRAGVSLEYSTRPWPEEFPALLSPQEIITYNCYLIGLEISPIYQDPESGEIFPFVLRRIQHGLSIALKKGAYEFSKKKTTTKPANYKALGRRAMVKAVWEVDHKLAQISQQIDFLLLVTPVNIDQSFRKFKRSRFEKEPVFYYRPISFEPSVLKRKLYEIPFDRIEDPTLSSMFQEKMIELELKLSMARERNTRNFFYGSMQLFGEIENELKDLAKRILNTLPPHSREAAGSKKVNALAFAERARKEIAYYRETLPDIRSQVIIRDDITGLMVSKGNLYIGRHVKIADTRMEALIQHEVGTHVLTYINGMGQPFRQLYCGLAGSEELQEGIAVLSEYLTGGLSAPRFRLLAARVIAAGLLIEGATFSESFKTLHDSYGFSERTAYIVTSRIYRSGGFTKDAIYLRGLVSLLDYIREGGDLETLFVGKISIEDIPVIKELQMRKVLKPLLLTPRYLHDRQAMNRLSEIKQGKLIFNLI